MAEMVAQGRKMTGPSKMASQAKMPYDPPSGITVVPNAMKIVEAVDAAIVTPTRTRERQAATATLMCPTRRHYGSA